MGAVKRWRKRWVRSFGKGTAGWLGRAALSLLSKTWRVEVLGGENLTASVKAGPGCFLSMWHGRMIVAIPTHARRGWHVLVSPSGDGDVSEKLLEANGYFVIRGSSSRGGARALRAMLRVLDDGAVLFITPDGPRGPMHTMNPGLAFMARATGREIVPLGFACDRAWHADSWDHFTIPKPFARVCVVYGEPVPVSRDAEDTEQEEATELVRERTMEAERAGFGHLGCEVDWPTPTAPNPGRREWAAETRENERPRDERTKGEKAARGAAYFLSGAALFAWLYAFDQAGDLPSWGKYIGALIAGGLLWKAFPEKAEVGCISLASTLGGASLLYRATEQGSSAGLSEIAGGTLLVLFGLACFWVVFIKAPKDEG